MEYKINSEDLCAILVVIDFTTDKYNLYKSNELKEELKTIKEKLIKQTYEILCGKTDDNTEVKTESKITKDIFKTDGVKNIRVPIR